MADFTWNFNRSPLPLGLKGEMFELNENSDFADVVKYFNDFDKANAWWIEHHPEDYNGVRGQQQQSNYVGNSRAAMNMKMNMNSPAAIEANNIAAATRVNHDEQNDRNAQFAKAAEIEDRAKTRNSEIQAIQNKISENNIQIDKLGKAIESIKIKYAKKADYEMTDDTVNENIAIADMLKIGEPGSGARDNTSFWRWREQQNDAKAARAEQRALAEEQLALAEVEKNRLKEKAIGDFNNKMTNFLTNPTAFDSTAAQNQYISNLNTLITEGQNLGADVSALIEKRNTLTGVSSTPEAVPGEGSTGSNADAAAIKSSLDTMKDAIAVRLPEIQGYDYTKASEVIAYNAEIDKYNAARDEAIEKKIIMKNDMPLLKHVPVPQAPAKTPEERKKDASDEADTAITQALTAKNATKLKQKIDDAKLTTDQKNALAKWIKAQDGKITATGLSEKINEIINKNGGK